MQQTIQSFLPRLLLTRTRSSPNAPCLASLQNAPFIPQTCCGRYTTDVVRVCRSPHLSSYAPPHRSCHAKRAHPTATNSPLSRGHPVYDAPPPRRSALCTSPLNRARTLWRLGSPKKRSPLDSGTCVFFWTCDVIRADVLLQDSLASVSGSLNASVSNIGPVIDRRRWRLAC